MPMDDLTIFSLAYETARRAKAFERPLKDLLPEDLETIAAKLNGSAFQKAERELRSLEARGVQVLSILHPNYPSLLKEIDGPPALLYLRGALAHPGPYIGVVGSRSVTRDGREFAFSLGRAIVERGGAVVSGLAFGCDIAAHRGSLVPQLFPGGAVLGSGVLNIYPSDHEKDSAEILRAGGFLLSECHPLAAPQKGYFPARNRIISGMAVATVIVEADEKSGSLITARYAAEQGRELFAVPGNVLSPRSRGTNGLIRDGARILTSIEDLTEFLPTALPTTGTPSTDSEPQELLSHLVSGPLRFDELLEFSGLSSQALLAELSRYELEGRIICENGEVQLAKAS